MASVIQYEPYHVHTSYSNCLTQPDSTMSIEDYAKVFRERGHHALCISEHGNRSNVYQQFELAQKYSDDDFKMIPIAAAEAYFVPDRSLDLEEKDGRNFHLILIAKDMTGLKQLNRAMSEANETGYYRHARVDFDILSKLDYRHFLCTTACVGGIMKDENAERYACQLHDIFRENFYLEIQHHLQAIQIETNQKILQLYRKHKFPLIYGTDSHYIRHEDAIMRKELLLSSGIKNGYEDEFDLYLPTAQEAYDMLLQQNVFSRAQIEEAMENTLQLREFEGVSFTTEKKIPNSHPELSLEERNYLYKKLCCDGYIQKAGMPTKEQAKELHDEMDAVTDTGTADYFLTMKSIVDKGIEYGGVLTTTGRGSGVSFATNFALGFTSINRLSCPVEFYPSRFISRERMMSGTLPDLDLNMSNVEAFEKAGKEILGNYGCLPMIAYGTAKTLSAFKLLARARDLNFEVSNTVSKQIQNYELDVKHAKENNQDDPDYDVDDDIHIEDYVEEKYLQLIEDSKQYKGIITSISPHPCAHLLLDKDIREEIGVIRLKAKSGKKEPVLAAYIDGATADVFGNLKADFLKVDVVKMIDAGFAACSRPVMPVEELLEEVKEDKEVWDLYANGYTIGLNQCERKKTTERVMRYKPKNVVELTAFVAAVRPGFKSMLETFVSRTRFSYNIPSLDKLLQTEYIPDSFLEFDEQILKILQTAGIPPADAYVCVKAIKKKKAEKVASFREQFETGFSKYLQEHENASEEQAKETVDRIWTIIGDAAQYMFCLAHAYSMACDSLYSAYLKAHYPYELYATMLKLYTDKGNKDKVALIIDEMRRYKNISLRPGQFGQDNRGWYIDKENRSISQALSSIKHISKSAAEDLYQIGQESFDSFTSLLYRLIVGDSCLNTRQIRILISVGYFQAFGGNGKLMKIFEEFTEGKNKIYKTLSEKSQLKRLGALVEEELAMEDTLLPLEERVRCENEYVGLCFSMDREAPSGLFFVTEVDSTYGVKAKLYSVQRGTSGGIRMRKPVFEATPFSVGDCIYIDQGGLKPRYAYKGETRTIIPGEQDYWITKFHVAQPA